MARIRTVKPELAAHEGMYDAEIETGLPLRFAWCMLFTVADREGRFVWRVRTLKAQVLPHDELDFSRVLHAWMTRGFIRKYRVDDEWYGWIPTFTKHQVINNRESPSTLPSIESADEVFQEDTNASGTRQARDGDASGTREVHAQGEGRKEGREGKGREISVEPERSTAVSRIFDHWKSTHQHPQARLDAKRQRVITTALKSYTESQLIDAISGYRNSPHHMGQNESKTVYDSIELMLRDAEHIDRGLKLVSQVAPGSGPGEMMFAGKPVKWQ